ncbi:MAG TPA: YtxH domain-containing protein [Actinobacteria bacterium]|jgi:gas vesicle protein|nr:YtxH domain-containing protein [Actinomycetota bacterium]
MSSENSNNEKSIFLPVFFSLLAGFAAGAVVGMLYAPKAGKEIRKDIKEKSEELIEKGKKNYEIISDKAKDFVGKSSDFIEKGKEKISHAKEILSEKISKGKEKAKEVSDYLEK